MEKEKEGGERDGYRQIANENTEKGEEGGVCKRSQREDGKKPRGKRVSMEIVRERRGRG